MPFLKKPTLNVSVVSLASLGFAGCVTHYEQTDNYNATPEIGAYMIVMGKDYNPSDLGPYTQSLPSIYAKYGGKYVALSTDFDVAEGRNDMQAVIISGWPDAESARTFWDSPEYREAIKLRDGIGEFDVVIVPALPVE